MKCVIHRLDSSPDNAGHGQRSVALEAPLDRVSARLRKEPTKPSVKLRPIQLISEPPGAGTREGDMLNVQAIRRYRVHCARPDSRANQIPRDVQGNSSPLLGVI